MAEGEHKHRDLWLVMIGVFFTLAGGTPISVWAVQQATPTADIHLWPNPFIAGAMIVFALGAYMLFALLFGWPLPGGIEGGKEARIPPRRKRKSQLLPGESLLAGQSLYSPDGRTRFVLQHNANMVVHVQGRRDICDTGTHGIAKCLTLERNGWLILYDVDDEVLWKRGAGGAHLDVQPNSHVVLYTAKEEPIWGTAVFIKAGTLVRHIGPAAY